MLLNDCDGCVYCQRMIAVGLGVRCTREENQKYKKDDDKLKNLPVIISNIPDKCEYKTVSKKGK